MFYHTIREEIITLHPNGGISTNDSAVFHQVSVSHLSLIRCMIEYYQEGLF